MTQGDKESQDKKFIDALAKDASATKAITKLNAKPKKVKVYRQGSQMQALEDQVYDIESRIEDEESQKNPNEELLKSLKAKKENIDKQLEELDKDVIEGILYPLTYRDINLIKAAATEAIVDLQKHNFDSAVIMTRVIAEERYMTVFCSLRKKDNPDKKYFDNLEEIALTDDVTVMKLYKEWEDHFVLTEDELKN